MEVLYVIFKHSCPRKDTESTSSMPTGWVSPISTSPLALKNLFCLNLSTALVSVIGAAPLRNWVFGFEALILHTSGVFSASVQSAAPFCPAFVKYLESFLLFTEPTMV
jgi:hypothetical protein